MPEPRSPAASLPATAPLPYAGPVPVDDDTDLMCRYAAGDAAALEPLYRRHNDAVYRYLLRLAGNRATAEELAHDVWIKLMQSRKRYQPSARFRTFLFRIAHNAFIDLTRRQRGQHQPLDSVELAAAGETAGAATDLDLLRQRFQAALAELPLEQKTAYVMHEESGLTLEEIALATGVNRETAKSRLRYAVRKLKDRLAADLGSETS